MTKLLLNIWHAVAPTSIGFNIFMPTVVELPGSKNVFVLFFFSQFHFVGRLLLVRSEIQAGDLNLETCSKEVKNKECKISLKLQPIAQRKMNIYAR